MQFLIAASSGLLGEVSRILNDSAEAAIRDGTERIGQAHLEAAAHAVA